MAGPQGYDNEGNRKSRRVATSRQLYPAEWKPLGRSAGIDISTADGIAAASNPSRLGLSFMTPIRPFRSRSVKKGVSTKQLQCQLGGTYKTASYMAHHARQATAEDLEFLQKFSGGGKPWAASAKGSASAETSKVPVV